MTKVRAVLHPTSGGRGGGVEVIKAAGILGCVRTEGGGCAGSEGGVVVNEKVFRRRKTSLSARKSRRLDSAIDASTSRRKVLSPS